MIVVSFTERLEIRGHFEFGTCWICVAAGTSETQSSRIGDAVDFVITLDSPRQKSIRTALQPSREKLINISRCVR
jgi:hypothetical protein